MVTSKDMYKILRETLAPGLKAAGYKRTTGGMLGWSKPVQDRHLSFWFQCDKYGWFQDFGSKVTLEFQMSEDPSPGSGRWDQRERFAKFLRSSERELVREMNNRVIRSLPKPSAANPIFSLSEELRKRFMLGYSLRNEPYTENEDVWLHYFTTDDVQCWGKFFAEHILQMIDLFMTDNKV